MTADTREKILAAALSAFSEKGYGVSVDDIAHRAGVVKQTLYHHFGSKDSLFSEALKGLADELLIDLEHRAGSLRDDLLRFARSYRAKALGEQGLALHRMMVSESPRFPELSRAVYGAVGLLAWRGLARMLREAMRQGELRPDDADFAADMLMSMLAGQERSRRLHGVAVAGDKAAGRVEQIVDCFLRAYALPRSPERVRGTQR